MLWDAATGYPIATLIGYTEEVTTVAFSPDGGTLASGSVDKMVRLWDVATGGTKPRLPGIQMWFTMLRSTRMEAHSQVAAGKARCTCGMLSQDNTNLHTGIKD